LVGSLIGKVLDFLTKHIEYMHYSNSAVYLVISFQYACVWSYFC